MHAQKHISKIISLVWRNVKMLQLPQKKVLPKAAKHSFFAIGIVMLGAFAPSPLSFSEKRFFGCDDSKPIASPVGEVFSYDVSKLTASLMAKREVFFGCREYNCGLFPAASPVGEIFVCRQ